MKETKIKNIGRCLNSEDTKWFIYSYFFEGKIDAIDFLQTIKKVGLIKLLKVNGLYQQIGARHTKKTMIDETIERFILLKRNALEYANSIINPSIIDIKVFTTDISYSRDENVFIGLIETILADICETIKQYPVLDYRIDLYIPSLKIAIEFDEKKHFESKKNIKEDFERQLIIESELDCTFYRIDERKDILLQIDNIAKLVIEKITGEKQILSGMFITESCLNTILDTVKDFKLYFNSRNMAAIGKEYSIDLSIYEKLKIQDLEEKMAFAIDMGYITSFNMLIDELRKLWSSEPRSQSGLLSECVTNQE